MITDYTTHEDVRAVLGVEADELENETLELHVYASGLESDLYEINPQLQTIFKDIGLKPVDTKTDKELRVESLTKAFATYSLAKQVSTSLPMFAPRSLADGKASLTRFSGEPYADVIDNINAQYKITRSRLQAALDDLLTFTRTRSAAAIFFAVKPDYDPVTGE